MTQQSQLERMGLFDARVPRYTSYPTAPHFTPAVGAEQFRQWLDAISPGAAISLYMHVPFCRRLCWFCACRTQGTQSDAPVRSYVETLLAELRMLRAALPAGVRLSRLHWGGGTPTLMPAALMRDLAQAVHDAFPVAEGAEFSVEIDPNEIDEPRMDALAQAGLTRASIGVQDFDPEIQRIIGREQSFAVTKRAVDMIRDRGIDSLNADILYGLPQQDPQRISDSVQKLLALSPDRVALYGYAHVPWMARRQVMIPSESLPDPQARLDLFQIARALFLADGYDEIGIDHFARPGDGLARAQRAGLLRRNFQGYTDDRAEVLIGLGASSISRFPQGYAQNAPATGAYLAAVRAGRFTATRGHAFSPEDLWRARMIEALMCDFQICNRAFITDFGMTPDQLAALYQPVQSRFGAMVECDAEGLRITAEGRPLTRMIVSMFDAYQRSAASHSTAI